MKALMRLNALRHKIRLICVYVATCHFSAPLSLRPRSKAHTGMNFALWQSFTRSKKHTGTDFAVAFVSHTVQRNLGNETYMNSAIYVPR